MLNHKDLTDEVTWFKARIDELESAYGHMPSFPEREGVLQSLLDNVLDGIITGRQICVASITLRALG